MIDWHKWKHKLKGLAQILRNETAPKPPQLWNALNTWDLLRQAHPRLCRARGGTDPKKTNASTARLSVY